MCVLTRTESRRGVICIPHLSEGKEGKNLDRLLRRSNGLFVMIFCDGKVQKQSKRRPLLFLSETYLLFIASLFLLSLMVESPIEFHD